ncbi:membrane protein insertase YidC [Clostridium bovifaecis]|uniref:Membrane protein insertase YidC n=1 Tax=Clostridium bovifaecis TaxID=2184719 RepID=A0A6I6F2G6_9CLOT|nr:membrane protein insertase YidC [Clostridium bovifaecis]
MNYGLAALKTNWLNNALVQFFSMIHNGVHSIIGNPNISYGLTIILVTVIIRLVLFPLNYKQIRSQVKMNEIQPELKKVQEKYKNDPQRQQQEVMKLYKDKGVNPLGGCLPLLLQWPILIALYYVFNNLGTIEPNIANVTFLGLKLMGTATSNPGTWILPILSGVLTYLSTAIMTPGGGNSAQAKQARNMSVGMSIFITYMSFRFTSALVLYWVTNSLIQIGQTVLMKAIDNKNVAKQELK